jgi:hypothetical protein
LIFLQHSDSPSKNICGVRISFWDSHELTNHWMGLGTYRSSTVLLVTCIIFRHITV